jgi:hypothetical protein
METLVQPLDYEASELVWWFVHDGTNVITGPLQCSGKISSPHTLVVCETQEECDAFILQNNLNK